MFEQLIQFTACGLVFDITGVLVLGFIFFLRTKDAVRFEAGTYWDANPHVQRSIIASKFDGMAGTALLFIGFIYQALGYLGVQHKTIVILSYVSLFIFIAVYFLFLRRKKIDEWQKALKEE